MVYVKRLSSSKFVNSRCKGMYIKERRCQRIEAA